MTGLFILSGQMDGWKTMSLMSLTLLHAPLTSYHTLSLSLSISPTFSLSLCVIDIHVKAV